METLIFGQWWRSHQSLARNGLRSNRFCVMPWKDEREPTIKLCIGRQVDVVQKFITIQSFGQNWWWAIGIRVEYFPRIHHIAAQLQSPRVPVQSERTSRRFHRTDYLRVDVQRHLLGISRKEARMRIKRSTRFDSCKKIFTRKMVIPRTWIRKEMVFSSRIQTTRRMGQSCGANDDEICRKRTPSLPIHESNIQRSAQEQWWLESCQYTSVPMGNGWNCFSHIISFNQLSIYGAVSDLREECKTCHVRTGRPVVSRQSDPLFVPSVMKTHIPLTDDPSQEDLLQRYQERAGQVITTKSCDKFLYWCRIPVKGWCRTAFHANRHWRILTIYRTNGMSWVHFLPRDENSSDPKGWIRGNTKNWARIGSHYQLPAR